MLEIIKKLKLILSRLEDGYNPSTWEIEQIIDELEKPILKEENFEIDFDGKLMAEFKILNGKIEVLKAMDGCGTPIKVEEIEIIYKK